MSNTDVLSYLQEGLKWFAICGGGYITLINGSQFISSINPFNEKIHDQKHLQKVMEEEAEKLGMDSSRIKPIYNWEGSTYADTREEGYMISLGTGIGCTRGSVKHELYHIKKGDCDRKKSKDLYYYFVAEPRATLYEVSGIKL